jgi:hypothetical protein
MGKMEDPDPSLGYHIQGQDQRICGNEVEEEWKRYTNYRCMQVLTIQLVEHLYKILASFGNSSSSSLINSYCCPPPPPFIPAFHTASPSASFMFWDSSSSSSPTFVQLARSTVGGLDVAMKDGSCDASTVTIRDSSCGSTIDDEVKDQPVCLATEALFYKIGSCSASFEVRLE